MLEVGWSEILVIAVVLIVVVGPKDLPPMLRAFGKMTTRLRAMAGQFQTQFNEALKEADLDDVRKTMQDAQKLNPLNTLREAITPIQQMGNDLKSELQKSVATPGPNPTVFPAVAETTDPVAEILSEPPVTTELPSTATAAAAVVAKPVVGETLATAPVSAAPVQTTAPVAAAAVPHVTVSADADKKPKKTSKAKEAKSEAASEAVVSADEPSAKVKRASKTKAAEAAVVSADEPAKSKKKKTAKSGTPEGDA